MTSVRAMGHGFGQQAMAAMAYGLQMRRHYRYGRSSRTSDCATEPDTVRGVLRNVLPLQEREQITQHLIKQPMRGQHECQQYPLL